MLLKSHRYLLTWHSHFRRIDRKNAELINCVFVSSHAPGITQSPVRSVLVHKICTWNCDVAFKVMWHIPILASGTLLSSKLDAYGQWQRHPETHYCESTRFPYTHPLKSL